jgi:hypothetical protein
VPENTRLKEKFQQKNGFGTLKSDTNAVTFTERALALFLQLKSCLMETSSHHKRLLLPTEVVVDAGEAD